MMSAVHILFIMAAVPLGAVFYAYGKISGPRIEKILKDRNMK